VIFRKGVMDFLKNLGPLKIAALVVSALLTLIILGFLATKLMRPIMAPMYTDLDLNDSNVIVAKLQALNIPFETDESGREIRVPADKVLSLRMSFAKDGIPASGQMVGYEIFDQDESLGKSQFLYNINLVRALEGELSRTINTMQGIDSARVHLVVPKKELFSKTGNKPSASVALKLQGKFALGKQEIAAITHLIANAVPGLSVDDVTIIDTQGRPLKLANTDGDVTALTETSLEYQINVQKKYKTELEEILENYFGPGKVKVNVTAEIDFDKEVIESEVYDPDGQVIRSRQVNEETEKDEKFPDPITVGNNIPQGRFTGDGNPLNSKARSKVNEVTNYEVSKTISNRVIENGRIKRLSIAVLIDGRYEAGENGKATYIPRTDEEIDKIKSLVVSAVGVDFERGDQVEVVNLQFLVDTGPEEEAEDGLVAWMKRDLQSIIQTVVIGIVILLIVILVIRPIILKAVETVRESDNMVEEKDLKDVIADIERDSQELQRKAEQEAGLAGREEEEIVFVDLNSPEDKKKIQIISKLNELVDEHPEETVTVIKNWMYED
jgi:flagellar M-ring protein FliF